MLWFWREKKSFFFCLRFSSPIYFFLLAIFHQMVFCYFERKNSGLKVKKECINKKSFRKASLGKLANKRWFFFIALFCQFYSISKKRLLGKETFITLSFPLLNKSGLEAQKFRILYEFCIFWYYIYSENNLQELFVANF